MLKSLKIFNKSFVWKTNHFSSKNIRTCSITFFQNNSLNSQESIYKNYSNANEKKNCKYVTYCTSISLCIMGGISYYLFQDDLKQLLEHESKVFALRNDAKTVYGCKRDDLPTYSAKEVNEHDNLKNGIWVTYKEGVYNVTEFVKKHPGGEGKLMMAAGSSIDPFWITYANHSKPEILDLLESMRIGNLKSEDVYKCTSDTYDPYTLEPPRHKSLIINNKRPFCAEPPPEKLIESFITPTEIFYVRNHLPVPMDKLADHNLEISIEDNTIKNITLEDLKKYPKYTVTSVVMCGGNRRSEMAEIKPIRGLNWGVAAVGNAKWSGARLCDILKELKVKEEDYNHVQFDGLDEDPAGIPYGASIPISKAMDPRCDVILAYEMNDEEIPIDHGFPIRVIVPGVLGARNVKWLARINLSKNESPSQFQQNDYKSFSPSTNWDNVDFSKSPAIQEMPVTSAICYPKNKDKVAADKNGTVNLKGYAWSGGGKKIIRVDVSKDKGKTWHTADLVAEDLDAKEGRYWAWTLWSLELPVDKTDKELEIWSKAVDASYNTQPENFENIWNLRGVLGNAYHKIKITLS